jgi:outer membrane receptor protein involved in Fe transport
MRRTLAGAAIALLFCCAPLSAQQTTGIIAGRVVDPQGAAVPGARVTGKSPDTGFVRTDVSDAEGIYHLSALPVGLYDVTVAQPGFATVSNKGIIVNVSQTQQIDFNLKVSGVAETVTVVGAPLIDTTASSVGQVVDPLRIESLPLNGRQFANLAATVPGVGLGYHSDPTKGANFAPFINGGAGRNINYLIDGGDNNDDTVGGLLQQFPLEAIQEFNFQTQRFTAQYGRSDGGVMNIVTKSGTNRYQGSFFELFRDKDMNALTETEKLAGLAAGESPVKGDYRRNQFGGSFGGPIVKDRVHFFFAIERTQQDTTQAVGTAVTAMFPGLAGSAPVSYRENIGTGKVAANLNPDQFLTVRYSRNNNSFPVAAGPTSTPDNWGDATNTFNSFNVNHNWVLPGSKLNEFIFQYSDYADAIAARTTAPNLTFPNGVQTGANPNAPQTTQQHKYQFRDDFSWHLTGHGGLGHDFKTGVNFINEPWLYITDDAAAGVPIYTMLNNDPNGPVSSVTESNGDSHANIPNRQYGLYIQDDWRVSDRLTLNLGLRYDLVTGLDFDQSQNPNFVKVQQAAQAGLFNTLPAPVAAVLNDFALSEQSDRDNFQPRVGGVYDLRGNGKDILRGGWGIYTDFGYTNSNVLLAALDASGTHFGPTFSATTATGLRNSDGSFYQVGQPFTNLTGQNTATGAFGLQGFWVDPRLQQPYQIESNAGWSHELSPSTVVSVDYVNSLGRDLNYKPRLNQLIPGTTIRRISALLSSPLDPNTSLDRPALSIGESQYNALILSARRRMSKGVDFTASYTYSRALSTIGAASDELNTANIQNPNNPFTAPVQLGPDLSVDARHRINFSAAIELPLGLRAAPFFLYRSALPVYLIDGRDLNGAGDITEIPARAYAVDSVDPATGKATIKDIGPCTTVNCGRGSPESQFNLRISKIITLPNRVNVELIGEVYNLFNALNPATANRRVTNPTTGLPDPSLLQPQSFSGDTERPPQRIGQIGFRVTF